MSGLEAVTAAAEDFLIPGLSYNLQQGASYVRSRRFSSFFPLGSDVYSPVSGQKLLRFSISDATAFLDLSSVRLSFQIVNQSANLALNLTGHPGNCIFERARLLVGGTLVEDILIQNRTSSMLNRLKPPQRLWTESLEMLGAATGGLDASAAGDAVYAGGPKPTRFQQEAREQ